MCRDQEVGSDEREHAAPPRLLSGAAAGRGGLGLAAVQPGGVHPHRAQLLGQPVDTQLGAGEEDGAALPGSVPAASGCPRRLKAVAEWDRARRVLSVIQTLTRMTCEAINWARRVRFASQNVTNDATFGSIR